MNVLGINGSPRMGGNTDILLEKALEGARDAGANTEKIILNNLKSAPCQECEDLRDDGTCIIDDELQPLYKKIKEADVVFVASPVFFGSLSAQTKMMIDRFQCAWRAKHILKKEMFSASAKGGCAFGARGGSAIHSRKSGLGGKRKRAGVFISVSASEERDFFDNSKSIIKNFFATINADYKGELFCPCVEKKGDILKHRDCLKKAYGLGQKITK